MHSIWRRLMYYAIGLLIGLLFVLMFFGTRGCNWLPENRIKASVFSQIVVLDTLDLKKPLADSLYIKLLSDGSVDLALSMRKGEPKSYYFSYNFGEQSEQQAQITFETDGVVAVLKTLEKNVKARAHINDLWLPIVHVPGDSNFINFSDNIQGDVRTYGLNKEKTHFGLKSNGYARTVAQDADTLRRKIHDFKFEIGDTWYVAKAKIYQSALEFLYIKQMEE